MKSKMPVFHKKMAQETVALNLFAFLVWLDGIAPILSHQQNNFGTNSLSIRTRTQRSFKRPYRTHFVTYGD
jgi:hypothetical protein